MCIFSKAMHIKLKLVFFVDINDDNYCLSIHPKGFKEEMERPFPKGNAGAIQFNNFKIKN